MLRDGMRIAYWPFALEPSSYAEGLRWVQREASHIASVDVELWSDLADRDERDLEGIDLVFVGGGNTYALLDHVRRAGWVDRICAHVLGGGAYYGGSAGAVLAGADIDVARFADPNDVGITDTTGLGLLGRAIVRPHWTDTTLTRIEAFGWATRLDVAVLAIPEDAGLVVVDGIATNTGPGRVAVVRTDNVVPLPEGESYLVHRSRR
jgi:dipeptidase E